MSKYKFKGTKGEWVYTENFDDEPAVRLHESGWVIGKVFIVEELGQSDNAEHDAHLISAAPELLQSLIDLNTCLDNYWNSKTKPDSLIKQITKHQQESLKAIHKALNLTHPQ